MNRTTVKLIERNGYSSLLYSHDDSITRHVVEIHHDHSYLCRINEVRCFRRGTHDKMARVYGFELSAMNAVSMEVQ